MFEKILERYEPVIGLEVHTHLKTKSKLFSPAPVKYGEAPNHDIHPIDIGLPGVLPVLNEKVVELAIRLGLATQSTVNLRSVFSRKNYFYPDLPKGYQISQYDEPVVSDGWLEIEVRLDSGVGYQKGTSRSETVRKRIGITRAHLEEDAGKSIHDAAVAGSEDTQIDLNRAGVPLLEIVSEPDLRSAEEASAYLKNLRQLLRSIDVSDADMEKGQFRCDANVSLRPRGSQELGIRTEIKNLNSFANVEGAIRAEIVRQSELLDDGMPVVQATMHFDADRSRTSVMRLKENADDYRYFDDPDLIPLLISEDQIERVRAVMPELPNEKRARFETQYGLSSEDAGLLLSGRDLSDFFEATAAGCPSDRSAFNWIVRDLNKELNEQAIEIADSPIEPESLAALIGLVESGRLTARNGRDLLTDLVRDGGDPEHLMVERGLEAVSDTGLIDSVVDEVVAGHPEAVESVRDGDDKPLNFLMGKVMQATQGKANPGEVRSRLVEKIRG